MSFKIEMDPDPEEFGRRIERAVKDQANDAVARFGHGLQEACDEVFAAREGKSVDEIFSALRSNIDARSLPVTLSDDKVRTYAKGLAEGRRVSVKLPPPL